MPYRNRTGSWRELMPNDYTAKPFRNCSILQCQTPRSDDHSQSRWSINVVFVLTRLASIKRDSQERLHTWRNLDWYHSGIASPYTELLPHIRNHHFVNGRNWHIVSTRRAVQRKLITKVAMIRDLRDRKRRSESPSLYWSTTDQAVRIHCCTIMRWLLLPQCTTFSTSHCY